MSRPAADLRLLVLYDADCGICGRSARLLRRLDRDRHLRLMPLQAANRITDVPPVEVLLEALHVRDPDGRWTLAGGAWARIAEEVPLLRPIAIVARMPGFSGLVEWAYALVARNRDRINSLLGDDACSVQGKAQ